MSLVIYLRQCLGQRIPFFNCGWEEAVSKYVCRVRTDCHVYVMI